MRIKRGATRTVFVFKKFVIKIPRLRHYKNFLQGLLANLQEREFKGTHPDLAHIYLSCPFGFFVIMQKACQIHDDLSEWLWDTLYAKYKDTEMEIFMLTDCKPNNWGYIENRLVKIDYGD